MDEQKLIKKKVRACNEGNKQQMATACHNLGCFYNERGLYEKALNEFKCEAQQYNDLGIKLKYGIANRMIGEMFMLIGKFDKALKFEQVYLNIAKAENDKIEIQRAFATIGRVYLLEGQSLLESGTFGSPLKNAEKAFIKSLLVCKELTGQISNIELQDMKARLYLNLSVTKENNDDFEKSLNYMNKAIAICKNCDLYELLHQCYVTTGSLYYQKKNDIINALRYFNLALEVAERLHNRTIKMCETLLSKSEVLIKTGDFQSAKQVLHKAYKLKTPNCNDRKTIEQNLRIVAALCYTEDSLIMADSTDYKIKKELYEKMGDGSCKLNNYSKAICYYLKMLENAELNNETGKDLVPIYISLYQTYRDNNEYNFALDYMWKEYELCKNTPVEAFNTLINIAEVSELAGKNFWDSENILQKARTAAQVINDKKLESIVVKKLIALQKKNGMDTMVECLEKEAAMANINLNINADEGSSEEEYLPEGDTPNIGDDICLDDLSDSSSDTEVTDKPKRSVRKPGSSNIIKRNNKGETQLHQACISGNIILVRRLLDQGHPVNVRDHAGWLPLHEACIHGHKDIVEMLLDRGAVTIINDKGGTSCDGITPLHDACSNGHLEIVELLLDRGANPTVRTDFGDTPLDTLQKWRKNESLDATEQIFYDTLRARISEKLDKVGIKLEDSKKIDLNSTAKRNSRRSINCSNETVPVSECNRPNTQIPNKSRVYNRTIGKLRYEIDNSDDDEIQLKTSPIKSKKSPLKTNLLNDMSSDNLSSLSPQKLNASGSLLLENSSLIGASTMYKNVMDNLRNKSMSSIDVPSISMDKTKKRSAYLDSEEVGDDWLEDDLLPSKKKRKYLSDICYVPPNNLNLGRKSNKQQNKIGHIKSNSNISNDFDVSTSEKENENQPICDDSINSTTEMTVIPFFDAESDRESEIDEVNLTNHDDTSVDAFDVLMQAGTTKQSKIRGRSSTDSRFSKRRSLSLKSKQQSSLLEAGFSRVLCESPDIDINMLDLDDSVSQQLPDSTSSGNMISSGLEDSSNQTTGQNLAVEQTLSIKIKVEEQLIIVPITLTEVTNLTMKWLSERVAKRFYSLHGRLPKMLLTTTDGAVCDDNDPISTLIDKENHNSHSLHSIILKWTSLTLMDSYKEACELYNSDIDEKTLKALETAEISTEINLSDFNIDPEPSRSLFKALQHHCNLTVINLSNNRIEDEGFVYLTMSLTTLKQLVVLNLSGNLITEDGIYQMGNLFNSDRGDCLINLRELILSYNPVGDDALKYLSKICNKLPNLTKLHLTSCELTNFFEYNLCFQQLTDLDLSFNYFSGSDCLKILWDNLSPNNIINLNLGFSIDDELISKEISRFFESPLSLLLLNTAKSFLHLNELNLSKCYLIDIDIWNILRPLKNSTKLKKINLSQNNLTKISFQYLINSSLSLEYLKLDGCVMLLSGLDYTTNFIDDNQNSKSFPKCITLSLDNNTDTEIKLEYLKKIWHLCWQHRGKIITNKLKVTMFLID